MDLKSGGGESLQGPDHKGSASTVTLAGPSIDRETHMPPAWSRSSTADEAASRKPARVVQRPKSGREMSGHDETMPGES